jgi:hypothetical protein
MTPDGSVGAIDDGGVPYPGAIGGRGGAFGDIPAVELGG